MVAPITTEESKSKRQHSENEPPLDDQETSRSTAQQATLITEEKTESGAVCILCIALLCLIAYHKCN